jgi:basic membrane lipoprotein Med (substrate-binding protein (PBP1-ABC) superfamily)
VIVTSAFKDLANSVQQALKALYANDSKWPADLAGKTSTLGAAEGCTGLPTAKDSWRFTTFTVDQYTAVLDKVIKGTIAIDNSSDAEKHPATKIATVDYQG